MPPQIAAPAKSGSWPMTVGGAGIAAAQFARCGFDVMIQAGHDKPWYDLVVTKAGNLLKIGVKSSDDGRWRLAESYLQRAAHFRGNTADVHRAIGLWLDTHGERTIYCLVQFKGVPLTQLPRIYLATPADIARRMRDSVERLGEPVLNEQYEWTAADTGHSVDEALPSSWLFSQERIQELLLPQSAQVPHSAPTLAMPPARSSHSSVEMPANSAGLAGVGMRAAVLTA
jgi:hypothetical protein